MKPRFFILLVIACLGLAFPAQAQWRHGGGTVTTGRSVGTTHSDWHGGYWRGGCYPYWRGGWGWSIGVGFPIGGWGYPYYGGYYPGYSPGYYPYSAYGAYYSPSAPYYASRPLDGGRYGGGGGGSVVAQVQQRLASAGYYRGEIDGVMGPRTRSAIRAYERRHGLPADGEIDPQLLGRMGPG